ncbi:MAG: hypothetical protein J1E05_01095 [Eubacterium sp.]|nr:hypothetical protein [Eubacterium sp.]
MSHKNIDNKNRWRNKIVSFRMSPEEAELLNGLVKVSGLNKQDYLICRALQRDVVIYGNPRVYIGLKKELIALYNEFQRLNDCSQISDEQLLILNQIIKILEGMNKNYE